MAASNEIEAVKVSLRINTVLFDDEISALIDSAKSDMAGAGVDVNDKNSTALFMQAIKFYCRAYFSVTADSEWARHYEGLRDAMAARGAQTE